MVNTITQSLLSVSANIVEADQYSHSDHRFFIRIEFDTNQSELNSVFDSLAIDLDATLTWTPLAKATRCVILMSKLDHCTQHILYQWRSGLLNIDPLCIISNHTDHEALADWYNLPYHYVPADSESESTILSLTHSSDLIIMARYMRILSSHFLTTYHRPVINIHHSFLPSFKGAKPYHQAFDRGVKLIGATAHYATANLDDGPIIRQIVTPITHRDTVDNLKKKGQQLEQQCLVDALHSLTTHRVIVHQNKTIVF